MTKRTREEHDDQLRRVAIYALLPWMYAVLTYHWIKGWWTER